MLALELLKGKSQRGIRELLQEVSVRIIKVLLLLAINERLIQELACLVIHARLQVDLLVLRLLDRGISLEDYGLLCIINAIIIV
jgi:hypothetical protein